jgi:hypothetical protein
MTNLTELTGFGLCIVLAILVMLGYSLDKAHDKLDKIIAKLENPDAAKP